MPAEKTDKAADKVAKQQAAAVADKQATTEAAAAKTEKAAGDSNAAKLAAENAKAVKARAQAPKPPKADVEKGKYRVADGRGCFTRRGMRQAGKPIDAKRDFHDPAGDLQRMLDKGVIVEDK